MGLGQLILRYMYFRKIEIASIDKFKREDCEEGKIQKKKKKRSEIDIYISRIDRLPDLYNCRITRVKYSLTIPSRVFRAPCRRAYGKELTSTGMT